MGSSSDQGAASPDRRSVDERNEATGQAGPLSEEQLAELGRANKRSRTILRATKLASFNGWTLGLCAFLCLPFAFFDIAALPIAACLAAVAYVEFNGAELLRTYDPRGPRRLILNQLVLLGLIVLYCGWQIARASDAPDLNAALLESDPALAEMLGSGADPDMALMLDSLGEMGELYQTILIIIYSSIIAASVLFQGLCALYYYTRGKLLHAYLTETPHWVVEIQRRS